MEYMENLDPLPLYKTKLEPLGERFVPLCPHRELYLSYLQDLPQEPGVYEIPDCRDPTCISPKVMKVTRNDDKDLLTTIPIAYTVTPGCPREAVRKSFNTRRIAAALRPAQLRICPHLAMNSASVSNSFHPSTTLHSHDYNGAEATDANFARHCCARHGPTAGLPVRYCQQCADQGFSTAYGFASRERKPTARIPHAHVEIQLVTYSNIGTLGAGQDDLDWVAHSHAEHELQEWRDVWSAWRVGVEHRIFWRPLARYRRCPVERERERKVAEGKARKCDEVARWRREIYGAERLDGGVWEAVEEVTVDGKQEREQQARRKRRRHSIGALARRLF